MMATRLSLGSLLLGLVVFAGCGSGQQETTSAPPPPAQVQAPRIDKHAAIDAESEREAAAAKAVPSAPFDLSYLEADSELFVHARPAAIVGSQFVRTLAGGRLGSLDEMEESIGIGIDQIDSVTIGVRNLQKFAQQGPPLPTGPMGFAIGPAPPRLEGTEDAIVVVRTLQPTSAQLLGLAGASGEGQERTHQSKSYYPLSTGGTPQPFLYVANDRTLIIAAETAIQRIINEGEKVASPQVDLSFIQSVPDLVLAVAPRNLRTLFAAAPTLSGGGPAAATGPVSANAPAAPAAPGSGKSFSLLGNEEEDEDRGSLNLAPAVTAPPVSAASASPQELQSVLEQHAEAVALMVDFDADVRLDVAVRCDTLESAAKARAVVARAISSGRTAFEASRDTLPGVIQQVVGAVLSSVQTGGSEKSVTVTATLPESQTTNLPMLPMAVMGMMMAGSMSVADMETMVDWQERAAEVLQRGQSPVSMEGIPEGLELRALARWGIPQGGPNAAAPLEVALVGTGELAARTVALGELNLTEVTAGNGQRLKWLGATSPGGDHDPVRELVPIEREGFFSRHPAEGFATGFTFAPTGAIPSTLSALGGTLTLEAASDVREVVLPTLPRPGGAVDDEVLRRAAFAAATTTDNGTTTVSFTYRDLPSIRKIELVDAAGQPVKSSGSRRLLFGEQIQHSIQVAGAIEPAQLGARITLSENVERVPVSFRFENLPLPQPEDASSEQQALANWSMGEHATGEIPEGLTVEAQFRWPVTQAGAPGAPFGGPGGGPAGGITQPPTAVPTPLLGGGLSGERYDDDDDRRGGLGGRNRRDEDEDDRGGRRPGPAGTASQFPGAGRGQAGLFIPDEDEEPVFGGAIGTVPLTANPNQSLQLAVDLTGPQAKSIVAVGSLTVDTVESPEGAGLTHQGSLYADETLTENWVNVIGRGDVARDQPPDGVRVLVLFAPPQPPIEAVSRFRGQLKIRSAREQVQFVVSNLNERTDRRIRDRNLGKYGLEIAVLIEENRLLFRLLEGEESRIAGMHPVDRDGARIADVVHATTLDNGNVIHRFDFPGRVPPRVGLEFSINLGVQEIAVPLRFSNLPVPPQPVGAGRSPGTLVPGAPPATPLPTQPDSPFGTSATNS